MGIRHFSGLFMLLCIGVGGALLTLAGEHGFYQLVLPHIRRRQNLKYWLHTSQKIHRALNMSYEDVKRQHAEKEKSCNLQKSQVPPGPPAPPAPGASAVWNNESKKDTADTASTSIKDARDFKRVHFNLETLNTRRLLARIASTDTKLGGAKSEGPAKPLASKSRLCENGGPPASFASLVLSLPSASTSTSSSTQPHSAAPPPAAVAPPLVVVDPPKPGELQELQEEIEQMREKLRTALARRAQIQTTLAKPVATVTETPTQVSVATTTATDAPPIIAPVLPLPANTKCVMTMTDPPHKVLSKVRPLQSRLANQRR